MSGRNVGLWPGSEVEGRFCLIGKYLEEPPLSRALQRRYAPAIRFARMVHQEQHPGGMMQPQRRTLENG
jgi:hypothetical protein